MKLTILIIILQSINILGLALLTLITIETDKDIDRIKTKIKNIDNDLDRINYRL